MTAHAYMNWGRWVADCPRPGCTYAFQLKPGQEQYVCRTRAGEGCGVEAPIGWPPDADEIERALARRPLEKTRNWLPRHHPLALLSGAEHGQSVADLIAESEIHGVK